MPRKTAHANKSELSRATGLDRATVTKRLDAAKVKPSAKKKGGKEVVYDADQALKVLRGPDPTGIVGARLKSMSIRDARELLKYKKEKGQLVDRAAALDEETRILRWVLKELTFRRRRAIVIATRKPRTQKEAEKAFTQNVMGVFSDLRENYRDRGLPDD